MKYVYIGNGKRMMDSHSGKNTVINGKTILTKTNPQYIVVITAARIPNFSQSGELFKLIIVCVYVLTTHYSNLIMRI